MGVTRRLRRGRRDPDRYARGTPLRSLLPPARRPAATVGAALRALPGVGVLTLCAAIAVALVVPALRPAARTSPYGPPAPGAARAALAASTTPTPTHCHAFNNTDSMTCTYTSYGTHDITPTDATLAVPALVKTVHFKVWGAIGGGTPSDAGKGGVVSGTIATTRITAAGWATSHTLHIEAGGNGRGTTTGGTGGRTKGGAGGSGHTRHGSGGGGLTGIFVGSTAVAIAGSGGGTGSYGAGEGPTHAGNGGHPGSGGTRGGQTICNAGGSGGGGGGLTGPGGGGGGNGCSSGNGGSSGSGWSGGHGGNGNGVSGTGGGGGGGGAGWYGGGGGGGGGTNGSGGGGGGGSSNVNGAWVSNATWSGTSTGYATVQLQWTLASTSTSLVRTGSGTVQAGQTATLEATVTDLSTAQTVVGAVRFYRATTAGGTTATALACTGSASAQPVTLSGGRATCTVHTPAALGTGYYYASFVVNSAFAASKSTPASLTIVTIPDVTTLSAITAAPASRGTTLGVTIVSAPTAPTPLATATPNVAVTFYSVASKTPSHVACTATLPNTSSTGSRKATCRFTGVPGSTYTFFASYPGDRDNTAATTTPATETAYTVPKATPVVKLAALSSTTVSYGTAVTLNVTVGTLPLTDAAPPPVSLTNAAGSPIDCIGTGQHDPVTGTLTKVATTNKYSGTCTFVPGTGGTATSETVSATYPGDAQTLKVAPASLTMTVTPATSTTVVAVVPAGGVGAVGVPISLRATVTNPQATGAPIDGTVAFYRVPTSGPHQAITGCTAVTAVNGVATCRSLTTPTTLTTLAFGATYCSAHTGACADWQSSTAPTTYYTPTKDPTAVVLGPPSTQTHPVTAVGGRPVTVTATVTTTSGSAAVGGVVAFQENGATITASGGGTCDAVAVVPGAVATTATATCTFVPVPGNEDTVTATYTPTSPSLTVTSRAAPWYVKVSGNPTVTVVTADAGTTAVRSNGSTPYGAPLTVTATVTVTPPTRPAAHVPAGTVAFSADGVPVPGCGAQPVSKGGTATCVVPPSALPAGVTTLAAAYAFAGGTFAKSTASLTFTVSPAHTTAALVLVPDGTKPGYEVATVTVTDTTAGAVSPPVGTVAVSAGTGTACSAVSLAPAAGPTASASCTVPLPTGSSSFGATFTPGNPDFSGSSAPTVTLTTSGTACSATFTRVAKAGTTLALKTPLFGGIGTVTLDLTPPATCNPAQPIHFGGGSVNLFGHQLVSSSISGFVADAQGTGSAPVACITGGSLGFPSSWGLGAIGLSSTERLCLTLGLRGTTVVITGFGGASLSVSGTPAPFGLAVTSVPYTVTATIGAGSTPTLTVHAGPTAVPTATPYVTVTVTVTDAGGTVAATGAVVVGNVPFVSAPLRASFTVSASTWKVAFTLKTATYAPVPGITVGGLSLTVSKAAGLSVTGTATLGYGTHQLSVTLLGTYAGHKWTLTATATSAKTWTPFSGFTVSPTLSGSIEITTAGSSPVVTYALNAGTVPTPGSHGAPLLTWSPFPGATLTVDCLSFAFGIKPACGPSGTTTSPTDPTVFAQGSLAVGSGSTTLTAGFMGSIDLKNGSITLSLDATAAPVSIALGSTGLTLTLTTLSVSGKPGQLNVAGKAQLTDTALGTTPFAASFSDATGALVVSAAVTFKSLGVPLNGLLVYASTTVKGYATGDATVGTVTLAAGFTGYALYHPTASTLAVLRQLGAGLSGGDTFSFVANWKPGGKPSFTLTLTPPAGFPFLTLPDGGSVTTVVLSYAKTALSASITGKVPVPSSTPASVTLAISIATGGAFTGTVTVTGLTIFGQEIGLQGTLSRATTGKVTANIASCVPTGTTCVPGPIPGPFTPFPGVPFQLSTVSFSLGTSGISVSGTMTVSGLGSLSVSGTLTKLSTWSIKVAASAARTWSPVSGITLAPSFTGTVTDAAGTVTFSLVASGSGGHPLFTLSPGGVVLTVTSVGLGNAPPPTGCTVTKVGDLWLSLSGSLAVTIGTFDGKVSATGCYDLTAGHITLSATFTTLAFSALTGHIRFGAPTLTISGSSGAYDVKGAATLTVTMPGGGSLVVRAVLQFESGGGFVVGAEVNLSQWLGTDGDNAYLYYASKAVSGFTTGDPSLKPITLTAGITFAVAIVLPTTIVNDLRTIHIDLAQTSHIALTAVGNINFAADTFKLKISVSLGNGIELFTFHTTSLSLETGFLQLVLSPTTVQFGVGLTARLHVPSPASGDKASTVTLTGQLSVSDTGINVTLSVGNCNGSTNGWVTAFGISGLTVKCAALTGGITYEFPFIDVGFAGTITSLPQVIATVTGYQEGAKITFAFNLDPFLLSFSIGTKNSTTPALEPLQFVGQKTLIKVYYASIYVSPTGATIGSTVYPAGFSMGFQATLFHVNVNILASVGFSPPSITFTANISKITVFGLGIGPVTVVLAASPTNFKFQFTGTVTLGPGSLKIGTNLKVGGELSATVQINLSKTGLSAFISGSMALTVSVYVGTRTCYTLTVFPYACTYQWETTGFSATLGKTGFSITSTGVTLEADGYYVTFDYNGHVSVGVASFLHGHHRHRVAVPPAPTTPPMVLTATRQPLTPGPTLPQTPASQRIDVGQAVLVPTHAGATAQGTAGTTPPPAGAAPVGGGSAVGSWAAGAPLPQPEAFGAVAALHDGDVLVAGGVGAGRTVLSSAEVYDPADNRWSQVGSLGTARAGATATVLADGKVLVAGGVGATHQPLSSAELFDPATGTFSPTAAMPEARAYAVAVRLPDGRVLVAGGIGAGHDPLRSAAVYDPATGSFRPTGAMATARAFPAGALLPDGQVLVAGGRGAGGATLATAERYDPTAGTWSSAGTMSEPRSMAAAAVMADGKVLVVGDRSTGDVYDPATGSWTQTQGMEFAPSMPVVAALPNGDVFVVGGSEAGTSTATAELYVPSTGRWLLGGDMAVARTGASAVVLGNGRVLVAGGGDMAERSSGAPAITIESSVDLYTPPTTTRQPPHGPSGVPFPAVVSSAALPIGLGIGGGVVLVGAALGFWAYEARRRRRPAAATVGESAPDGEE